MKQYFALFIFILGLFLAINTPQAADSNKPTAYVLKVEGVISPATQDLITRHLKLAANRKADIVVLEMHTPGGLVDSMQVIIQDILASPVPVATYVSPSGSHAASAGTYILYASHIAAMAPSTNIGAATPIQMGGGGSDGDGGAEKKKADEDVTSDNALGHKMINDASAYIRGLAELRGRNGEWAEKAVREAKSITASEALSQKVIDVIADDIPTLLEKIDGKTVKMAEGKTQKLRTKGATIEKVEGDWRFDILSIITHPNVALLLMSLGFYGLIYEFSSPGSFFPGVFGAISLLLGLYAVNILPVNYAGLALVLIGLALMTAEGFIVTHGVLGVGGVIAFALGATMLFDSDMIAVDWWMIAGIAGLSLLVLCVLLRVAMQAQKRPTVTGIEELLSSTPEVLNWAKGSGEVRVTGEIWRATASGDFIIQAGDRVRVVEVKGLELIVAPLQ